MKPRSLCGFHRIGAEDDEDNNIYDVLGATAPVKIKLKKAGSGKGYNRASHKAARKGSIQTAKKALAATIAAAKSAQAASTHATRATIHGVDLIGALPNPTKPLTDKQKKAVDKLKKATEKNTEAAKKAANKGTKAAESLNKLMSTLKKHRGTIIKTALKAPKTKIAGDFDYEDGDDIYVGAGQFNPVLPAWATTLPGTSTPISQSTSPPPPPPPTFDPTQTRAYSWSTKSQSSSTQSPLPAWATTVPGTSSPISSTVVNPSISNNEAAQAAGVDTTLIADATTTDPIDQAEKTGIPSSAIGKEAEKVTYHHVPSDGVVYDGTQFGWPSDGFMSWNYIYGGGHGYAYTENTWKLKRDGWDNRTGYTMQEIAALSAKNGYGPIIGNPRSKGDLAWTHGLKYAIDDDKFFWFPDDAPDWATAEKDREAEILKAQEEEAAAAAAEAQAAANAQAQAQKEEEAAKREAELAFQQEQANIQTQATKEQADIAYQQQETQYAAQERQANLESAKAQQQADIQAQQAQLEIEKIRAANEVELARLRAQAAQQPAYGPPNQGGGAYADGGGYPPDEEGYPDEGPVFDPRDQGSVADGSANYEDPFANVPYPQEEEDAGR